MKRITISFSYILLCWFLISCEYDDRYHYVGSYRLNNQLGEHVSGYLIPNPAYYSDSIFFQVDSNETLELFTDDGGDGPTITPKRTNVWTLEALRLNLTDTTLNINVESQDEWDFRTEENIGIYTFSITEDLL
jgi:hypothetical protein